MGPKEREATALALYEVSRMAGDLRALAHRFGLAEFVFGGNYLSALLSLKREFLMRASCMDYLNPLFDDGRTLADNGIKPYEPEGKIAEEAMLKALDDLISFIEFRVKSAPRVHSHKKLYAFTFNDQLTRVEAELREREDALVEKGEV